MVTYTYDFEILTMSTVFMNAMSDIVVKRFNDNREPRDQIKARVVYAPKQRVLNDLLDKDQNIQLPVLAVTIGGIARDENRVFNKLQGLYYKTTPISNDLNYDPTPLPIDVTFNVSILTRYQQDMDQIISHLIPYINPYFVVSWRTPGRQEFEIRSNVVWNGQVNVQYPVDATATTVARVTAELSFTFKGWLFRNLAESKPIFSIDTTIAGNNLASYESFIYKKPDPELAEVSNFVYDAVAAKPDEISPFIATKSEISRIKLWGTGFERTVNVFLSGTAVEDDSTTQSPFAGSDLETQYPEFEGIMLPLSSWKAIPEKNLIVVTIPDTLKEGKVDVIVQNPYSYGPLIANVVDDPTDSYTPPFVNGLIISENKVLTDKKFRRQL